MNEFEAEIDDNTELIAGLVTNALPDNTNYMLLIHKEDQGMGHISNSTESAQARLLANFCLLMLRDKVHSGTYEIFEETMNAFVNLVYTISTDKNIGELAAFRKEQNELRKKTPDGESSG